MNRRRFRPPAAFGLTALLTISTLVGLPGSSTAAPGYQRSPLQQEQSVPGHNVTATPAAQDTSANAKDLPAPVWPKAGASDAGTPSVRAREKPGAAKARIEVLDRATTDKARVDGVLLKVDRADVTVEVDYSAFRYAFGGDWASRLVLNEVPDCALSTPDRPECALKPLPTRNNTTTGKVSADIAGKAGLLAVAAAASGPAGDYTATDVAASAEWSAGGQSGDFGWSYPMRTPPVGPSPTVELSYSAGSVDGRTIATNNQPSWIGEGFSMGAGSISRVYKGCSDDMTGGNNAGHKSGDLCWAGENVSMSLGGRSAELVLDQASQRWRMREDDGTKIEQKSDASFANGDQGNQYWLVTTTDGTKYTFGRHRLPGWSTGKPVTNSTWTVPVFGNHEGEPCHQETFGASFCQQAWRWNLDHVVDIHGNVTTYYYGSERNFYGRNNAANLGTPYVRGGWLERIEYGIRTGEEYGGKAPGRVQFEEAERCNPGGAVTCLPSQLSKANGSHWPDTPTERLCAEGTTCTGLLAPTFFTSKRLNKVTTEVLRGTTHQPVDSWTLKHEYKHPGDLTSPSLWLQAIQHTGHLGGTPVSLPETSFIGVQRANRVDALEGQPSLTKWRLQTINNETGGAVFVEYAPNECAPGQVRKPETNTQRCFPQRWAPTNEPEREDWFHKTVVARVSKVDMVGKSPTEITHYDYIGPAAWHWDESDLTPTSKKTWAQWRGYGEVNTRHGADGGQQTLTKTIYFRGMDGDYLSGGGSRDVKVKDSTGALVDDHWRFAGVPRERIEYNGPGAEISGTITDLWLSAPTASRTRAGRPFEALMRGTAKERNRTTLGGGVKRVSETVNTHNDRGQVIKVNDLGAPGAGDDRCTTTTYTGNEALGVFDRVSHTRTIALACGGQPVKATDIISDTRTYFDGSDTLGAVPGKGNPTKIETLTDWTPAKDTYDTTTSTTYDDYGRPTETVDVLGSKTTTGYTPATGGPVRITTVTNHLGHTNTTEVDPGTGQPIVKIDANQKRTTLAYDALGRLVKTWLPGRNPANQTPNQEFSYLVRKDGPYATISKVLQADGGYKSSLALFDGHLRPRQNQAATIDGKRVLTDQSYDTRGLLSKKNGPYLNNDPMSTNLLEVTDNVVPGQTVYQYDLAGRQTAEIFRIKQIEQWRTSTTYGGDRVTTDPPNGSPPFTKISNTRGATVELRQFKANTPSGPYDTTKYTPTNRGDLAEVVDPAGNKWSYTYDMLGRQISKQDPDSGVTTMKYDKAGQLESTKDSRGTEISHTYDAVGRLLSTKHGSKEVASWTYDTAAIGQPYSTTRITGDQPYTKTINAYNDRYQAIQESVTIPAVEGKLAQTYRTDTEYDLAGNVSWQSYPEVGGLAPENVRYTYNALGQNTKVQSGLSTYVTDAEFSPFGELLGQELSSGGDRYVWLSRRYQEGTRRVEGMKVERTTLPGKISDTQFSYDNAGNVTGMADTPDEGGADKQCFEYDYLRRLTEAWTPVGECSVPRSVAALGGADPYWRSYRYDKSSNRSEEIDPVRGTTSKYNYPAVGQPQPHALQSVVTTGATGSKTVEYDYDLTGNTTVRGDQALEWDTAGKLAKVTAAGKSTTFAYDSGGNRLLRRDPDGTTLSLGSTDLKLDRAGNLTATRYYSHGGSVVAMRTSAGVTWLAADHHGTGQTAIADADHKVTRRRMTPFGEERSTPAVWPGDRGFIGGTKDSSTGLTHIGAREYDPATGRFISVDPIIDHDTPQQMDGYGYANGNPVTISDPTGKIPCADPIECEYYRNHPEPNSTPGSASPSGGGNKHSYNGSATAAEHRTVTLRPPTPKPRYDPNLRSIIVPCGPMGLCKPIPIVPCSVKGLGPLCYIDVYGDGRLTDIRGVKAATVYGTGERTADGNWGTVDRKLSGDKPGKLIPVMRNPVGKGIEPPKPKGMTVSFCAGGGWTTGLAFGAETCLAFDKRGIGRTKAVKGAVGPGTAISGGFGIAISNAATIEDLGGHDGYITAEVPVKVGPDAEVGVSTNFDGVWQISGGVGAGFGVSPGQAGISEGTVEYLNTWESIVRCC